MPYQKGAYGPPNKKHDIVVVAVDSFRCFKRKSEDSHRKRTDQTFPNHFSISPSVRGGGGIARIEKQQNSFTQPLVHDDQTCRWCRWHDRWIAKSGSLPFEMVQPKIRMVYWSLQGQLWMGRWICWNGTIYSPADAKKKYGQIHTHTHIRIYLYIYIYIYIIFFFIFFLFI